MSSVRHLRRVGLFEGISFLLLLGVAMPLKYLAGQPLAVKIAGWIHGLLFILFCIALARAKKEKGWSVKDSSVYLIAALLPFGPFVIDKKLKAHESDPPVTAP
jgi:integral membrane protein